MVFLGAGGWIMAHGDDVVLSAPFFSNPGLVRTGLWSISSDTSAVDRYMSRYDVEGAGAILVGHAHYDHLMDVPRIARAHAPEARIVVGRTVANTLGSWSGVSDRVDWHPEALVENLHPRRILLSHWEDFFSPVESPARELLMADLGHFEERLEGLAFPLHRSTYRVLLQ